MKAPSLWISCALLLWCVTMSSSAFGLLVWLKDGRVLHVSILEHNEQNLTIQRLDNQGVLEIRWDDLHPICQEKLRSRLGIGKEQASLALIQGVKAYLKSGGSVKGVLQQEKATEIVVRNKTGLLTIQRSNLYKLEQVDLDLLEVYQPQQIYELKKGQYNLESADGNLQFGKMLVSIGNAEKAKIHLEQAKSMKEELAKEIDSILQRMEQSIQEAEIKRLKDRISLNAGIRRYSKALELLSENQNKLGDVESTRLKNWIEEEQKRYFEREVPRMWLQKVDQKISILSGNRKTTLDEARRYVQSLVQQEVKEDVARQLDTSPDQIEPYFAKRNQLNERQYSYKSGTFIVGIKDSKAGRALRNESLFTPDGWWLAASSSIRREWLMAFYAEAHLTLVSEKLKQCPHCNGTGTHDKNVPCAGCHGIRYEKIVVVK